MWVEQTSTNSSRVEKHNPSTTFFLHYAVFVFLCMYVACGRFFFNSPSLDTRRILDWMGEDFQQQTCSEAWQRIIRVETRLGTELKRCVFINVEEETMVPS